MLLHNITFGNLVDEAVDEAFENVVTLPSSPSSCLFLSADFSKFALSYSASAFLARNCWSFSRLPLSPKLRKTSAFSLRNTPQSFYNESRPRTRVPESLLSLLIYLKARILEIEHDQLVFVPFTFPDFLQLLAVVVQGLRHETGIHRFHFRWARLGTNLICKSTKYASFSLLAH